MKGLFVVHASVWDVVALMIVGGFAAIYFIVWAAEAWRQSRKKK